MRMSDWSSDVCSSDLPLRQGKAQHQIVEVLRGRHQHGIADAVELDRDRNFLGQFTVDRPARAIGGQPGEGQRRKRRFLPGVVQGVIRRIAAAAMRSEEHTSELQSLMRSSYAVFCLKKKTKTA